MGTTGDVKVARAPPVHTWQARVSFTAIIHPRIEAACRPTTVRRATENRVFISSGSQVRLGSLLRWAAGESSCEADERSENRKACDCEYGKSERNRTEEKGELHAPLCSAAAEKVQPISVSAASRFDLV